MKILIVCSNNSGSISPFVSEQADALTNAGVIIEFFPIIGKGFVGYLKNKTKMLKHIKEFQPDLIHAHFGLSGVLANMQNQVPVVTTYHGCDINRFVLRVFSYIPLLLSEFNIFVSNSQVKKVKFVAGKYAVIPCGVNFDLFKHIAKKQAREALGWQLDKKYILFSSSFDRPEKNALLAKEALRLLSDHTELVELKGFSRYEVMLAMNASDCGLLTSIREGSPMFVKEMLACKRPVVTTNVGDVQEQIASTEGCFIVPFDKELVAKSLLKALQFENAIVDESKYQEMDNQHIAEKLIKIYTQVLKK